MPIGLTITALILALALCERAYQASLERDWIGKATASGLAAAAALYQADHPGHLPGADWPYTLQPYLGTAPIRPPAAYRFGFTLNAGALGRDPRTFSHPQDVILFAGTSPPPKPVERLQTLAHGWGAPLFVIFATGKVEQENPTKWAELVRRSDAGEAPKHRYQPLTGTGG